ncbi:radical SAM protein [Legionella spiritensis]|uniref:radical SAM protein n=1 Tax=Legionella spiritensis TaxID=452 RepID=UPI000F6E60EF|nr:radical SAM protein [Legionella spiritensis]VEG91179.1 molybdenum cofactor biosynthesis protein A [Legionella spiritensis]
MTKESDLPFSFGSLQQGDYIWLTLTNLCNIHCKYCFNYVYKDHQHMSPELAKNIIKTHLVSLDKKGTDLFKIIYFGGEPTLNHDALISTVDFLIENDVNCHQCLMTNGIYNTKTFNALLGKGIDFQVSYDGAVGNLRYSKNQKKVIVNETVDTIKKLISNHETVKIRATIHNGNVQNIPDLVRFCDKNNIAYLMCSPICDFGDSRKNNVQQPDVDRYVESLHNAYELSLKYGVNLEIRGESYFKNLKNSRLNVPFVWFPDGYVAMTITYASSKEKGANNIIIGKYDEFQKKIILNNPYIEQMKDNFKRNFEKYCAECPLKDKCRGDIHFTPFATDTFDPKRDYYFCNIAKKMVQAFPDRCFNSRR